MATKNSASAEDITFDVATGGCLEFLLIISYLYKFFKLITLCTKSFYILLNKSEISEQYITYYNLILEI